ncbi:MAG: hypothetical protein ACLQHS_07320 [Candidatus Limnocylindrales bacterium]
MSDLEAAVAPVIGPTVADPTAPLSLSPEMHRVLARWCAKTTLVLQTALMKGRKAAYVPRDNLDWLPGHADPPPGTYVWTFLRHPATLDGRLDYAFATAFSSAALRPGRSDSPTLVMHPPSQPEAYIATFAIGYLGFHVFGQDRPPEGEERRLLNVEQVAALSRVLVPLWPTPDVVDLGTPRYMLGPGDIELLSRWGLPYGEGVLIPGRNI